MGSASSMRLIELSAVLKKLATPLVSFLFRRRNFLPLIIALSAAPSIGNACASKTVSSALQFLVVKFVGALSSGNFAVMLLVTKVTLYSDANLFKAWVGSITLPFDCTSVSA